MVLENDEKRSSVFLALMEGREERLREDVDLDLDVRRRQLVY